MSKQILFLFLISMSSCTIFASARKPQIVVNVSDTCNLDGQVFRSPASTLVTLTMAVPRNKQGYQAVKTALADIEKGVGNLCPQIYTRTDNVTPGNLRGVTVQNDVCHIQAHVTHPIWRASLLEQVHRTCCI